MDDWPDCGPSEGEPVGVWPLLSVRFVVPSGASKATPPSTTVHTQQWHSDSDSDTTPSRKERIYSPQQLFAFSTGQQEALRLSSSSGGAK